MDFKILDNYKCIGGEFHCPICHKHLKVEERDEVWGHGEYGTVYSVKCSCLDISHVDSMYSGYKENEMRELVKRAYIKKVNKIIYMIQKNR